ncbi:MAG: hypothetical protein RIT27_168 [Pseudomonadota bacterium]|jgi:hypothetical protein
MKTVRERIIENIVAQLEAINTNNGYENTLGNGRIYRGVPVIRRKYPPPVGSVWELPEKRERNQFGGTVNRLLIRIDAMVETIIGRDPASTANGLLGDITKALMLSDVASEPLIDDLQDVAAEIIYFEEEECALIAAVSIDFEIRYITEWGNPYTPHNY